MATKLAASAVRELAGFFALQSGQGSRNKNMLVSDANLRRPLVSGLTIRQFWSEINPAKGKYDFSFFLAQAARANKLAKGYKLLPMSGTDCRPAWLKGEPPWSPVIVAEWAALCREIQSRFGDDPGFRALHVTAPTWDASAEAHTNGSQSAGYTPAKWGGAWKDAILRAATVIDPAVSLIFSISVQQRAKEFVPAVCDYGRATCGPRFVVEHNALHTKCAANPAHHKFVREQFAKGSRIMFEQVCAAFHDPQRYGSSDPMAALQIGINHGACCLDVYSPDLAKLKPWVKK